MVTLASFTQGTLRNVETVKPSIGERVLSNFRAVIVKDHAKTAEQLRRAIDATIAKPGSDIFRTLRAAIKRTVDQPTNGLDLSEIVAESGNSDPVESLRQISEALESIR